MRRGTRTRRPPAGRLGGEPKAPLMSERVESTEDVVEEFTVALQKRSPADKLGVQVAYDGVTIRVIGFRENGMVGAWNARSPGSEVMKDDRIVAVGGVRVTKENFKEELARASGKVEVLVQRTTTVIERAAAEEVHPADRATRSSAKLQRGRHAALSAGGRAAAGARRRGGARRLAGAEAPEWLPEGWTVEIKVYPSQDMWLYVSPHGRKTKLKREVMQIAQEESSGVLKQEGAAAEEAPEARDDDEEAEAPAVEQGGVAAEVEDAGAAAAEAAPPEAPAEAREGAAALQRCAAGARRRLARKTSLEEAPAAKRRRFRQKGPAPRTGAAAALANEERAAAAGGGGAPLEALAARGAGGPAADAPLAPEAAPASAEAAQAAQGAPERRGPSPPQGAPPPRRAASQRGSPPRGASQPRGLLQQGGSTASTAPRSSARVARPGAPWPPPPASAGELFAFLQCQLRTEAGQAVGELLELEGPAAKALWADYEEHVAQLVAKERWVPFHRVLEANNFFLIRSVLHCKAAVLDERRKFFQIFIFAAHCRQELFLNVQRPHMLKPAFWDDPVAAFGPGGDMERDLLAYRTSRVPRPSLFNRAVIIPGRVSEAKEKAGGVDENIVQSLVHRTRCLLEVAEAAWSCLSDTNRAATQKCEEVAALVEGLRAHGSRTCPAPLLRLLLSFMDLAFPQVGLLESQREVEPGALGVLGELAGSEGGAAEPEEALRELTSKVNACGGQSADCFWATLGRVEELAKAKFGDVPRVLAQMGTRRGHLPASVLHAQLCEYQQFRQGRRPRAPSDASAGAAAEPAEPLQDSPASAGARAAPRAPRARPPGRPVRVAGAPQFDEDHRSMRFEVGGVPYWVTKEQASGSLMLAERVASLCAARFREGARQEEVEAFREELLGQCSRMGRDAPDAPYESDAWPICQASCSGGEMVVNFRFAARRVRRQRGKGRRGGLAGPDLVHFRTSAGAAGGSVIQAERVARLCYEKFKEGASREDVRAYRAHLYRQIEAGAKRKQGSG